MKIKIITIHCISNFGSVFQAASLQKFLKDHEYDSEIIDYRPKYFDRGRNAVKTLIGRILNNKAYNRRRDKFNSFIENNMTLTERAYKSFSELYSLDKTADVYIAGGDQLWNDYHFSGRDPAYKLAFISQGIKISFGTSLGRDNLSTDEVNRLIQQVSDFSFIGLREKSSIQFFMKAGFKNVMHVTDPVLLLKKDFFEKLSKKPKISNYVLIYLVDKSSLLDRIVEFISKELKLEIVHICGFQKKCYCDYFLKDSGPEEILGYIINANLVISASFHATLFSLLFNKDFVSLLPGKNTNARIIELLDYVGLSNRIITDNSNLVILEESIDYSDVNNILEKFAIESQNKLIELLKSIS